MPSGKRASMREGPLAALFRKTAQDTDKHAAESAPTQAPPPRVASEPTAPSTERREMPAARAPEPEVEEPRIPLPHERLRHAFSADIPENMLDRAGVSEPAEP